MPLLRTTWIFQIQRHSFSESWYRDASSADPRIELEAARQYAVQRAQLLGQGSYIYGIRISNIDDRRQKAFLEYVNYQGNAEESAPGVPLHPAAASNVALNVEFNNLDNTQEKLLQLRGIWDEVETGGGAFVPNPVYTPLLQAFIAKVVTLQYGWRYSSTVPKVDITTYVQGASGQLTFTLGADLFTVDQVNKKSRVPVRIAGCGASPNLNGALTVQVIDASHCISIKPIAVRPAVATFNGTMQRNTLAFTKATLGRVQRLGKRQAGAPLLQSAGRGPVRKRG